VAQSKTLDQDRASSRGLVFSRPHRLINDGGIFYVHRVRRAA